MYIAQVLLLNSFIELSELFIYYVLYSTAMGTFRQKHKREAKCVREIPAEQ